MKTRFIMRLYENRWRIWDRQQSNWRGPPASTPEGIVTLKARLHALNTRRERGKR